MPLADIFDRLVKHHNTPLSWGWLPDDHVPADINTAPFKDHDNYFIIRLSEMYLHDTRVLWKKYYPMVNAFVDHGSVHSTAVAGPGQLKDLGSVNLERLIGLHYPLSDLTVYRGEDITFLIGLYAVESEDAAKVLLTSLGQISTLAGLTADVALQVANVVKSGVEGVLNLNGTTLQLGVRDALLARDAPASGPRAGYLLAINAPSNAIDYDQLWVVDGRLVKGKDREAAKNNVYDEHDYMLIEIERRDTRADWRSLPEINAHQADIDAALQSGGDHPAIVAKLQALWPQIAGSVRGSQNLTKSDQARVLVNIKADIQQKLDDQSPVTFELKRMTANRALAERPSAPFNFLEVPDLFVNTPESEVADLVKRLDEPFK